VCRLWQRPFAARSSGITLVWQHAAFVTFRLATCGPLAMCSTAVATASSSSSSSATGGFLECWRSAGGCSCAVCCCADLLPCLWCQSHRDSPCTAPTVTLRTVVFRWWCVPAGGVGFVAFVVLVWPLQSGHWVQQLSLSFLSPPAAFQGFDKPCQRLLSIVSFGPPSGAGHA
jgi:hypothetical protein